MYTVEMEKIGEERSRLIIKHNGIKLRAYCDGGEPEDNYFFRDWSWVEDELLRAYELGKADARNTTD